MDNLYVPSVKIPGTIHLPVFNFPIFPCILSVFTALEPLSAN
jgi:hypothetical protein